MIRFHQRVPVPVPVPTPHVLSFAILAVALAGFVPAAHACTCMPPGPPLQELEKADAVFAGRVVSIEPENAADADSDDAPVRGFVARLRVTLEVEKVWKGLEEGEGCDGGGGSASTVQLLTASQSAMCGYSFAEGERYLVYAYRSRQQEDGPAVLTATLCSRTAPLERAEDDLAALGTPARTVAAPETHR